MSKATIGDLIARAESAIEREDDVVWDVAGESCQIVGNVKHMTWFKYAVAEEIQATTKRFSHLGEEIQTLIAGRRVGI